MEPLGGKTSDSTSKLIPRIRAAISQGDDELTPSSSSNPNDAIEGGPSHIVNRMYMPLDQSNERLNTLASLGAQLYDQYLSTHVFDRGSEAPMHPADYYSTLPLIHPNANRLVTQSSIVRQDDRVSVTPLFEFKEESAESGHQSRVLQSSLDHTLTPNVEEPLDSISFRYRDESSIETNPDTKENSPNSDTEDEAIKKRQKRINNNLAGRKHRKKRAMKENQIRLKAKALEDECRTLRETLERNNEHIRNLENELQSLRHFSNKDYTNKFVNVENPAVILTTPPQYEPSGPEQDIL